MQMSYVRKLLPTSGIKKKYTENQLPSEVKNGDTCFCCFLSFSRRQRFSFIQGGEIHTLTMVPRGGYLMRLKVCCMFLSEKSLGKLPSLALTFNY